jgi:hypothetical protein
MKLISNQAGFYLGTRVRISLGTWTSHYFFVMLGNLVMDYLSRRESYDLHEQGFRKL